MAATIQELRILLAVLLPFACLVTYFRFYVRYSRGKLWWDDFWVLVSTMCAIVFVAASMLHVQDPASLPQHVKISVYYMCAQFFYAVVWTARISILFTVMRLCFFGKLRRLLFWMAVLFFFTWAILFAQVWWVCERQPDWKELPTPQCALGLDVAIAQLITDVISDIMLIAAPTRLLWRARLQRSLKVRLLAVFATTAIGTIVSLYHAYCVIRFGGIPEFLAATVQLSISLLVANLSVIVAVIYRLRPENESDNTEPVSVTTIGGRGRKQRHPLSTMGATVTAGTQINVHIVQTNGGWNDTISGVESANNDRQKRDPSPNHTSDPLELDELKASGGDIASAPTA
ncbi:hypothetical protein C8R47DRAFT_185371 [Mycena vitilis]|nr:hypothetical protein C8R47DRAFT_185371 [Mycena vitilis]